MEKILLIDEIAALMRVAVSTVRRWLGESRRGRGNFPLPISPPGGKLRWREIDILRFIEAQGTPPVTPAVTSFRRQQRDRKHRAEAARIALERHRKPK